MSVLTIQVPDEVAAGEAQLLLAIKLLEVGRAGLGQAAQMAGLSKRAFLEVVAQHDGALIDYPADDLRAEARL